MKHSSEDKEDLYSLIFSELKVLGVKIPKIKKCKLGASKQIQYPSFKSKIFGVNLSEQEWVTENECTLPKFLLAAINYLHDYTKAEIGLFRKAGSVARQRNLRAKLENGGNFDGSEPNDVASLLKQWLRELPEPLIPCQLHDLFIRCQNLDAENARLSAVLLTCLLLPCENLYTLKHLFLFLSEIAENSEKNKMVPHNLAVIMAPNILSPNCDRSDSKAGSDFVQCHTALVELLIFNAEKIGEIPPNISTKLSLKFGELESSIEVSNCSPSKLKKKRKGAGVIDIMCGIRRFVGGNITHISDDALEMCEFQPNQIPELGFEIRSNPKRKASHNICDSSEKIKKPILGTEVTETLLLTPVGKSIKSNSLVVPIATHSNTRTRRKSFGLLRKKYHKRGKSGAKFAAAFKYANPLISVLCNNSHDEVEKPSSEVQEEKLMDTLTVPTLVDSKIMSYTSPILRIDDRAIKRALSDCNIHTKCKEMTFQKYVSLSYSDLSKKRSSSRLKSSCVVKRHSPRACNDEKCFLHGIHMSSYKRKSSKAREKYKNPTNQRKSQMKGTRSNSLKFNVESQGLENLEKVSDLQVNVEGNSSYSCSDIKNTTNDIKIPCNNSEIKVNIVPCLKLNEPSNVEAINISGNNENINISGEQLTINCQENQKLTNENEGLGMNNTECGVFKTPNIRDANRPMKSSIKKGANKHSIRRGRPNTIRTGLPSDICPKYAGDSISSSFSEAETPIFDEKNKTKNFKRHSSPNFLFPEEPLFDETKVRKSLTNEIDSCSEDQNMYFSNTSLNTWLNVTQPEIKQKDLSILFTTEFSKSNGTSNDSISFSTPVDNMRANSKKQLSNTWNEIQKYSNLSDTYSFEDLSEVFTPDKEQNMIKDINIIPATPPPKNTDSENLETKDHKIENEAWMSAKKFVKNYLHSTPVSAENLNAHKRESIIQLMRINAGKVQASVQHYNDIANKSPPCNSNHIPNFLPPSTSAALKIKTRSMSLYENTTEKLIRNENRLSRRRLQSLKTNKESAIDVKCNLLHKESHYKSPIITSPKIYNANNNSPVTGCPLREVTNISKKDSFSMNISSPACH